MSNPTINIFDNLDNHNNQIKTVQKQISHKLIQNTIKLKIIPNHKKTIQLFMSSINVFHINILCLFSIHNSYILSIWITYKFYKLDLYHHILTHPNIYINIVLSISIVFRILLSTVFQNQFICTQPLFPTFNHITHFCSIHIFTPKSTTYLFSTMSSYVHLYTHF